jgi:hypothetical protein
MPTTINIERKRGDTCAIVFVVQDADSQIVDISFWTNFLLTVDPLKAPTDALSNIFQATGSFVTDGTDGKVQFEPPGNSPIGSYYYDVQVLDNLANKCTIAEGKYKIRQDITKD